MAAPGDALSTDVDEGRGFSVPEKPKEDRWGTGGFGGCPRFFLFLFCLFVEVVNGFRVFLVVL